jgi:hypothetical protein
MSFKCPKCLEKLPDHICLHQSELAQMKAKQEEYEKHQTQGNGWRIASVISALGLVKV